MSPDRSGSDGAVYRGGEGTKLLLLHGAAGSWRNWRPVLAPLAERFDVIAPTLPGHNGGPPLPPDVRTFADMVPPVEQLLDDLGLTSVHIAGNSLGAALGIQLAAMGRARSVVALSPVVGWEPGSPDGPRLARYFEDTVRRARLGVPVAALALRTSQARHVTLRRVMCHGERVSRAQMMEMVRDAAGFTHVTPLAAALRSEDDALPRDLERINVPVLLAWAGEDRVVPPQSCAARYRRLIAGAEFRLLPGTGHLPMWDDPDLIVHTITDWVHAAEGP